MSRPRPSGLGTFVLHETAAGSLFPCTLRRCRKQRIARALCFFLGALLLHPSAVEAATSAMEVVAVSGANAALLVAQRIGGAQRRQGGGGDGHDKVAPRDEL